MTRLANVCAWQVADRWRYAETRQAAAPIAVEMQRYESEGRIVPLLAG